MSYCYAGVKYKTQKIGEDLPDNPRLDNLIYWCKIFHEKGLAPPYEGGSYGNLSFRLRNKEDIFIITASHSGLADSTTNDRFVTVSGVDLKKCIVSYAGSRKPSSEAMVHYAVYHARPYVQAVFHGHCDKISKNAERLGIPITSKEEPYGTIALVNRVMEILGDSNFLEMRNHGFLALGTTMDETGNLALDFLKKC
ncbi:class II aldolase/adducin family protein [Candidatus Woesearchaeota archaeon]|nr:class II aldolase/adducin family protein [Candidatus Woesearchaeota archaeon]